MFIVEGPYLGVVLEEGAELGEGPELGKTTSRRLFSSVAPHEVYDPNISTIVVATFYAAWILIIATPIYMLRTLVAVPSSEKSGIIFYFCSVIVLN